MVCYCVGGMLFIVRRRVRLSLRGSGDTQRSGGRPTEAIPRFSEIPCLSAPFPLKGEIAAGAAPPRTDS